ncbi:MAG: hypothetical protein F4147_02555 [Gammaproteobacteria bacterium]|nr:hypothetical protein [Gammaproteobacteria bacterium]
MDIAVIELNDSEVTVVQSGHVVARSPGIAVIKEDRIELGQAALQSTHMDPRNTFSRFWSNLNQDGFKHSTKLARHNADLAYAHLLSLHEMAAEVDHVVFAVPGSFTTVQLSLLLGLAQASPFSPGGLVDSAVAATAAAGAGSYNHLDIHLHQTVITSLEVSGSVDRVAVKVVDDVGLLDIQDKCVNHIADLFIRQSRFDPLHHASTEQALCNSLAQCLQELRDKTDTQVEIGFENARYQARVNRERLVEALRPLYNRISAAADPARVSLVNGRLAGLPVFTEHLAAAGIEAEVLDERAVFAGCMGYVSGRKTGEEEIYFVTQLRAATEPAIGSAVTASLEQKPEEAPTHVLVDAEAHPLGQTPLYLSAQGALSAAGGEESLCSLSLNGAAATLFPADAEAVIFINGQAVDGNAGLRPGDVISFANSDREFTLIRVLA